MFKFVVCALIVVALGAFAYSETQAKKESIDSSKSQPAVAAKPNANDELAASATGGAKQAVHVAKDPEKIDWKKVDWRKRLTRLQYHITREAGTERPFQNEYWDHFEDGEYQCVGCGLPLFESTSKFDAHCGWPSFDRTLAKDAVTTHVDRKLIYPRTEIRCRRCGAHLGHVFDDGPTETGKRYCLNSAAMKFRPAKGALEKTQTAKEAASKPTNQPSDGLAASAPSDGSAETDSKERANGAAKP
jgi:peptide-methionine (R)-S-oxide reductase